jgi:signal transduction histidine kinase
MRRYSEPSHTEEQRVDDIFSVHSQLKALKEQQSELFADLARGQTRFRNLARSVWRVQEDERRKFARDLHDGLGQSITAIMHQLQQLAQEPELSEHAQRRVERTVDLCARAVYDIRNLARLLRPKILDDLGLSAALHWLGRTMSDASSFAVDVDFDTDESALDGEIATLIFRLAQESLNNAAKHARATHVLVKVWDQGGRLNVLIADDGCGCDPEQVLARDSAALGTGLGSMRERVALFGGSLHLVSSPGDGTQVRVVLPIDDKTTET